MILRTHLNFLVTASSYMDCSQISTVVATQKFNALHPILRVNASDMFVFRLRNSQDLNTFIEDISALIDKPTLLEMYKIATKEAYSFFIY